MLTPGNPPRQRPLHLAAHVRRDGGVSPIRASSPRAINLRRGTWTLRREAVTCKRCLKKMGES